MPFTQHIPRVFTATGVRMYAPMASGVYGISNAREWIYIGTPLTPNDMNGGDAPFQEFHAVSIDR